MLSKIIFYYKNYLQFREELRFCSKSQLKIHNFWPNWPLQKPEDLWFHQFITKRSLIPNRKQLSIFSVFGNRLKMKFEIKRPKIFFTGENPINTPQYDDYCLGEVNLALGFDFLSSLNYMRFPLWYLYVIKPWYGLSEIQYWISGIEAINHDSSFNNRKFCCLVAGHDPSGNRKAVYELMSQFGNISSGGAFLKNTDELKTVFQDNKRQFLEQFKFNIAVENSDRYGYVTEKIFHSIESGCIPIYWGSNGAPESDILNQDRIIFYDPANPRMLINKLLALQQKSEMEAFLAQPVFKPDAAIIINKHLVELEQKIKQLFL